MKTLFSNCKTLFAALGTALILATAMTAGMVVAPASSYAATVNQPPNANVEILSLHVSGQYTATTTAVARLTLPFRAKVIGVQASARASGGTSPTLTVDVLEAAVSILSAPMSITAGAVTEAVITDDDLADESAITVNFAITGTAPTWNDMTILLVLVRY